LPVYYCADYVLAGHAFETTRKSRWVAESLAARPIPPIELVRPSMLTEKQLCAVHNPDYVAAVRTGEPRSWASSQGFEWDPGLWAMVLASNSGAVEAALAARRTRVAGSLSSGLHHARHSSGLGFCTFNGLALATRAALDGAASRVLIVDLDAHCGGGTFELLGDDARVWQCDVSVCEVDRYRPGAHGTLDIVWTAADYLPTVERRLAELTGPFDLCLYNAGMDPYEGCPIGGLDGITRDVLACREKMVFEWCASRAIPIAFVLAGGYLRGESDRDELVELHRLTLSAAATRVL
jgi:acetoin utilization deacetylase AcuC-like enzyme